jgi:hypothetical protein
MTEKEDSLDLIYEVVRDTLRTQQEQKSALETKASMLLLFAGGIFALLMNSWNTLIKFPAIGQIVLLGSVSLFAASVILAIFVIWVRKFRIDPEPRELARNFLNRPTHETKLQLISNWGETWKYNLDILEQSSIYLRLSFMAQALAFVLLGIALFVSVFRQ